MSKMSISFTLGKASKAHGGNIEHNNREFIADNIDPARIDDNITYVKQDITEAYDELFKEALNDYNLKQTRSDRKIHDYLEHISTGGREEAFYEIVVQFGDSKIAPVGSPMGETAKKMLDEYMRSFIKRNKNLHVFNAILHLDETSPHLHIDVIPFYTKDRKIGMEKGVSMKSALAEQGFNAKGMKTNQLVMWEDNERSFMESILKRHGFSRDIKKASNEHETVNDYKETQDTKKVDSVLRKKVPSDELTAANFQRIKLENSLLKTEKEKLNGQKNSPWKSFYYSQAEKQAYVQTKLTESGIPFREAENGFEAQECYVEEIRKLEKEFTPVQSPHREELRNNLDRIIMQSKTFEDVLERLKKEGYSIKQGKYLAVKPKHGNTFIRVKSLGEHYSEQALRNRINDKLRYEADVDKKIASANTELAAVAYKTVKHYTLVFAKDVLPMRKINKRKPFMWTNCAELDKLSALNKKINAGATLESLRKDFAISENNISKNTDRLEFLKNEIVFFDKLYNAGQRYYEYGEKNKEDYKILTKHKVLAENYNLLENVKNKNRTEIAELEKSIPEERAKLKAASDILSLAEKVSGGTYVQSLISAENERRQSKHIPNGLKRAD